MSDLRPLLSLILDHYRLYPGGIHGVTHWARVLENGRRLAPATGADITVVELFAIFHDACRRNDGHDPDHGPRAAELVLRLRETLGIEEARTMLLAEACRCHTYGPPDCASVTVLTCLDADRLDIPRVGRRVRPELLFSDPARDPETIRWASRRAVVHEVPRLCAEEWGWQA